MVDPIIQECSSQARSSEWLGAEHQVLFYLKDSFSKNHFGFILVRGIVRAAVTIGAEVSHPLRMIRSAVETRRMYEAQDKDDQLQ